MKKITKNIALIFTLALIFSTTLQAQRPGPNTTNPNIKANIGAAITDLTANIFLLEPLPGNHLLYRWEFGDGSIVTTRAPQVYHTYERYGSYEITLKVMIDGIVSETQKIIRLPRKLGPGKLNMKNITTR